MGKSEEDINALWAAALADPTVDKVTRNGKQHVARFLGVLSNVGHGDNFVDPHAGGTWLKWVLGRSF